MAAPARLLLGLWRSDHGAVSPSFRGSISMGMKREILVIGILAGASLLLITPDEAVAQGRKSHAGSPQVSTRRSRTGWETSEFTAH